MGYTTEFSGQFKFNKPLQEHQIKYLQAFNGSRRMKRDETIVKTFADPLRYDCGLTVGVDGEFYVNSAFDGHSGQGDDPSVIDHNSHPARQHGLWCQWRPSDDGYLLEWDGSEKFYNYVEWLHYIIDNFIIPWGNELSGVVSFQGEDSDDCGYITVKKNKVKVEHKGMTYSYDEQEKKIMEEITPEEPKVKRQKKYKSTLKINTNTIVI